MGSQDRSTAEHIKHQLQSFFKDYKRLFSASKPMAVFLFLASAYLGLFPVLELIVLGGWIDALIGARSLRVWTSDVQVFLNYQIVLLLTVVPAIIFVRSFTGIASRLSKRTMNVTIVVSAFIAGFPASPIIMGFLVMLSLMFVFVTYRPAHWIAATVMLLLVIQPISDLTRAAVEQDILVGQMITWSGAMFVFVTLMAIWVSNWKSKSD